MGDFWTTFFYVIVMVAIIVAAYLATKYLAGKGRNVKSRQMRILDRMMLGKDKHIVLLEVGDKNLLIGVTNQTINVLGDIDGETLKQKQSESSETEQKGFASKLRDFAVRMKNAPSDLNKARTQGGNTSWPKHNDNFDYLRRMDEAIERRKGQADDRGEDE